VPYSKRQRAAAFAEADRRAEGQVGSGFRGAEELRVWAKKPLEKKRGRGKRGK
jgi:hypothetical protein